MNKNLPIIKKNTELTLSKTKSLIDVTSKILSNKKRFEGLIEKENNALVDDSWMERLWAWADEKKISDNTLPRNKVELLRLKRLFLSAFLYEEWGYPILTELPNEIGNLTNLTEINLQYHKLVKLPKEIGNLTNLERLDLESNKLTSLPKEISNLVNLTYLDLTHNNLTSLQKEIFTLTNLTALELVCNGLTELPREIGNLKNLTYLDLEYNELTELPREITNLTKLRYLNLNKFDFLPSITLTEEQKKWILKLEKDNFFKFDINYNIMDKK